jgi:hypothetical protein
MLPNRHPAPPIPYFVRKQSQERFKELCEHAQVVDDPRQLAQIAAEICQILESAVAALKKPKAPVGVPAPRRAEGL